jgi:hypothetical protein
MKIENDPRLTAYALGELGEDEMSIFEQELANAGGASTALSDIRSCAHRLREAYAAEPVYAMTDEQRAILLADASALPVPVMIDEEVQHSDKVLPWVTQPVISEVDKQKIAEALKPTRWRQVVPILGSLGVAASVVWLAAVVLMNQHKPSSALVGATPEEVEDPEPIIISLDPPAKASKSSGFSVLAGLPPYRYGAPIDMVNVEPSAGDFLDPAFLDSRRSAFPILEGGETFETLRRYLAEGQLPPADAVRVAELLNAFDYAYAAPQVGQTFAVDTELASCPWAPDRQLLQIGVRASDLSVVGPVAEDVSMAVEFNPATVAGYRLIGETEGPTNQGVSDPAGDSVGAGQSVTALYEVVPRVTGDTAPAAPVNADEMVTVRVDYKEGGLPEAHSVEATVADAEPGTGTSWREASDDFRFAASVAGYGMLLGKPESAQLATYELVLELARNAVGEDPDGKRHEFLRSVEKTIDLKGIPYDEGAPMLASPPKAPKKKKRR